MAEKWSGDGSYYLPARQVEPYRLWFEFLNLAHRDPDVEVDYDLYEDWGEFWSQPFNDWWVGSRWRNLFAVDATVRVLNPEERITNDETGIVIRLPLCQDPKETLKDVADLLDQYDAGIKLDQVRSGKFALSAGYEKAFLKYLPKIRVMLRLYRFWLEFADFDKKGRVRKTAIAFYTWAKTRDDLIRERQYKYERPDIPFAVATFAQDLIAERTPDENDRRSFMRYLQKARKLGQNAGQGQFPGQY